MREVSAAPSLVLSPLIKLVLPEILPSFAVTLSSSVEILVSGSVAMKLLIMLKSYWIELMSLSAVVTREARAVTVVLSALSEVSVTIEALFARMSLSAVLKSDSILVMVVSMFAR